MGGLRLSIVINAERKLKGGSPFGFQALSTILLSVGLSLIFLTTSAS